MPSIDRPDAALLQWIHAQEILNCLLAEHRASGEVSLRYLLNISRTNAVDSPLRRVVCFDPNYPFHMNIPEHVTMKTGPRAGATVAVFCGVHGNERAGILAVERFAVGCRIEAGTVFFVRANPPAIEKNVRYVDVNLNRQFIRKSRTEAVPERRRAEELMDLLDGCDALLDLHSYPCPAEPERAIPFAICEKPIHPLAALLDVPVVVDGFTQAEEGGSDGYMHLNGKIGICVELGAIERPDLSVELGVGTIRTFLAQFGCVAPVNVRPRQQRHLTVSTFYKKAHRDFRFTRPFRHFDAVSAGEPLALENGLALSADRDSLILFPDENRPVGTEAFLLAEERGRRAGTALSPFDPKPMPKSKAVAQ